MATATAVVENFGAAKVGGYGTPSAAFEKLRAAHGPSVEDGAELFALSRRGLPLSFGPASFRADAKKSNDSISSDGAGGWSGPDSTLGLSQLRFDSKLNRVFIELMNPTTGDVVATLPPRVLVQSFNRLAVQKRSEVDTAA